MDAILRMLMESSYLVQEGCATSVELDMVASMSGREAVGRRLEGLWFPYYISFHYFWRLREKIQEDTIGRELSGPLNFLLLCALAAGCLAVDILEVFDDYTKIQPEAVESYLLDSENHPDRRLGKLVEYIDSSNVSFQPLFEGIYANPRDLMETFVQKKGTEGIQTGLHLRWQLQLEVNRWLSGLGLFPIRNMSRLDLSAALGKILRTAFEKYGAEIPQHLKSFQIDEGSELLHQTRSYVESAPRKVVDQVAGLGGFPQWIEHAKMTDNCFVGSLAPGNLEGESFRVWEKNPRYILGIAGLNISLDSSPARFSFNGNGREIINLDTKELKTVCRTLVQEETIIVVREFVWSFLEEHKQQIRNIVEVPLCVHHHRPSVSLLEHLAGAGSEHLRGTMLRRMPVADLVLRLDVEAGAGTLFHMFFISEILVNMYCEVANELSIPLETRLPDYYRQEDRLTMLACWECTLGFGSTAL